MQTTAGNLQAKQCRDRRKLILLFSLVWLSVVIYDLRRRVICGFFSKSDCEVQFIIFCWAMCPASFTSARFPRDGIEVALRDSNLSNKRFVLLKWPQEKFKAMDEQTYKTLTSLPYTLQTKKARGFLDNVKQQRETNRIDHNTMISLSFQLQKIRRKRKKLDDQIFASLAQVLSSEVNKTDLWSQCIIAWNKSIFPFYSQNKSWIKL